MFVGWCYVTCNNCHTAGPFAANKEEAVNLWNAAPRKKDVEMEKNCGSCKYNQDGYCSAVPPYKYFQVDSHLCCTDWAAKESISAPLNPSNSSSLDVIGEIVTRTLFPSNVRQLIEEAAELIVACNKYIRATGNGQPTPVSEDEALAMIAEELADVHIVGEVLMRENSGMEMFYHDAVNRKPLRWKRRLDGEEQDHTEPGN